MCTCVWVCAYEGIWRPEEVTEVPGTGVIGNCKLLDLVLGAEPGFQERPVLI